MLPFFNVTYIGVGLCLLLTVDISESNSQPCTDNPTTLQKQTAVIKPVTVNLSTVFESNSNNQQLNIFPVSLLTSLSKRQEDEDQLTTQQHQQSNSPPSLLSRLANILARYGLQLPADMLMTSPHPEDMCSRDNADLIRHYCNALLNGLYYDPWNPWCGYIECNNGRTVRRTCPTGSWMGVPRSSAGAMTQIDMCRTPLPSSTSCMETTMQRDLCRHTESVHAELLYYVDPAEDLQTSLSDLFVTKETGNSRR